MDDRISYLPDGIRESILSNLTSKEAGATCVLSRRWRTCWQFSKVMDFDASHTLLETKRLFRCSERYDDVTRQLVKARERWYADTAYVLLKFYMKSPTMDSIRLCFPLSDRYRKHINGCINSALDKNTRRLQLNLTSLFPTVTNREFPDCYDFLWESYVITTDVLVHTNTKLLTRVSLKYVQVSDETFHHLLTNCPDLQSLCIKHSDTLKNVYIAAAPSLKHLKISGCAVLECIRIVSAAVLLSFKLYVRDDTVIDIISAPRLTELGIGEFYPRVNQQLLMCSLYLSGLRSLTIKYESWLSNSQKDGDGDIPELANLKHLEIHGRPLENFSLLPYLSYFMERCPNLSSFKMKKLSSVYFFSMEKGVRNSSTKAKHSSTSVAREIDMEAIAKVARGSLKYLRVAEFSGFIGSATDVEIVMFLLNISAALDKIIIRIAQPLYNEQVVFAENDVTEDDREQARDCALQIAVPGGTQLLVLI